MAAWYRQVSLYGPYTKQRLFHQAGADHRERLFLAGNQLGKTLAGGMEFSMHLTGNYADWWEGRRFTKPVRVWSAGLTNQQTRDNAQRILFGPKGEIGTGTIPRSAIKDIAWSRVISDFIDTATIYHKSGLSHMAFKAYRQGKQTTADASPWGGETLDMIWFDEEPPEGLYGEGLARISATDGMVFITATPLLGMTNVIRKFYPEPDTPYRHLTQMSLEEVKHIPASKRAQIIAGYPPHEREARSKGIPMLGSGRVYPFPEDALKESSIPIPPHWPQIGGVDFGWDHPTACVWAAWDRDNDVVHLTHVYRQSEASPVVHSAAMKARGAWMPWAWPHDGLVHHSGEPLADSYRNLGVKMLPERTKFMDGGSGVEAGIMDLLDRMQTGRFKVASHLEQWFDEFRHYHRKDGKIVKEMDDLMDATRYLLMSLRFARTHDPVIHETHSDLDYDPFNPGMPNRGFQHHRYLGRVN